MGDEEDEASSSWAVWAACAAAAAAAEVQGRGVEKGEGKEGRKKGDKKMAGIRKIQGHGWGE